MAGPSLSGGLKIGAKIGAKTWKWNGQGKLRRHGSGLKLVWRRRSVASSPDRPRILTRHLLPAVWSTVMEDAAPARVKSGSEERRSLCYMRDSGRLSQTPPFYDDCSQPGRWPSFVCMSPDDSLLGTSASRYTRYSRVADGVLAWMKSQDAISRMDCCASPASPASPQSQAASILARGIFSLIDHDLISCQHTRNLRDWHRVS